MTAPPAAALSAQDGKQFAHLLPPSWKNTLHAWFAEDCPSFDYGGYVVGESILSATLYAKSPGVLAGVPFFTEVFTHLGCSVQWSYADGDELSSGDGGASKMKLAVAKVSGPARLILLGERVALNTLARCSGVATASRAFLEKARAAGFEGIVAGTRKTTPGFRLVEKYGMLVGGVDAHRYDLSSMVMLKDNHIWACSRPDPSSASSAAAESSKAPITRAIEAARRVAGFALRIDVEVQSLEEARLAIAAGADVVMLDNMQGQDLIEGARLLKKEMREAAVKSALVRPTLLESSGGIDISNVAAGGHLDNAIDIISTSSIHQSTKHVDFSLKIDQQ
ncbi:nicotinate-nucleotide diphosphorylase (carboxylating) [Tilletia horrida]|uniref:Nicotinate-nucleotide pyrophosphorylase [carboxylating] n=1 Tax=Tilletia horrida TaxID=155126 RepID=A0AAN6GLC2_9BASI|nr:nicotinate-nucleotide diphosphorylase (carboxylating) [Tilletia horrida]KAK0545451.1 nicotinate-nucleotide diphosphorylase (carboxylating) [Tilletia horrida]KAK0561453.1 nicotinate-nucleotide diphosphorylase (carboxylating) [Tilletia horrida]